MSHTDDRAAAARTEAVFSSTAATYDPARVKLIPGYAEFYAAAVALLPNDTDHVLDLGAGTGLLSASVRERFPKAYLELIDTSEPMLRHAQARFANDQETCFIHGDYTTHRWGLRYDAVVSALSRHHQPDEAKRSLFARVLTVLKLGGIFINADQILQVTPLLEERARSEWLTDVRGLGATEKEISDSLLRQQQDRCSSAEDQKAWLEVAGFTHVGCSYGRGRFAVLHGSKPY